MLNNKILSIAIPAYNVSKYLPEVLPTYLIPEVLQDLELIIVNDGSQDNTGEIAFSFAKNYPDTISVINKENGGHGSAINAGAKMAKGKYFKVIDGDDWVDSKCLRDFICKLRNTDADVVLNSFVRVEEGSKKRVIKQIDGLEQNKRYLFRDVLPVICDSFAMHGTTFRTELFRKARKIDEHCFYVDQEYLIYPAPYICDAIYYDIPVYQYRVGNVDQSMSLKSMQKNRSMHERVIMSLIEMLPSVSDAKVGGFIRYRIAKMCQLHIDILFTVENQEKAKEELGFFLKTIKEKNDDIFKLIPGKKAKLLRIMGASGYFLIKNLKRG